MKYAKMPDEPVPMEVVQPVQSVKEEARSRSSSESSGSSSSDSEEENRERALKLQQLQEEVCFISFYFPILSIYVCKNFIDSLYKMYFSNLVKFVWGFWSFGKEGKSGSYRLELLNSDAEITIFFFVS